MLFDKTKQRITISSDGQQTLEALASELRARKLKDTKVSPVTHSDDQWRCVINCKQAETIYYQEILPLLYDSTETQSFDILLEFNDEGELVKECSQEILASFSLKSRYAYGDKAEHEFMQKMHRDILQASPDTPAAITYYIVGGGAVTMCVPCADPTAMERTIRKIFATFNIKQFLLNTIDRTRSL